MASQTLTIGKRRFVLVPEREYQQLQKKAAANEVRAEVADAAMKDLKAYRKAGKAANWKDVKRKLGL
jgi:hypothetical protein